MNGATLGCFVKGCSICYHYLCAVDAGNKMHILLLCIFINTHTHTHTTVLRPSWMLSGTTRVSRHQKGKTNLDLLEQEIVSGSGISWVICKSAPWLRHVITPVSHHSVFYRPDALPATQPTASKHWKQTVYLCSYSEWNTRVCYKAHNILM